MGDQSGALEGLLPRILTPFSSRLSSSSFSMTSLASILRSLLKWSLTLVLSSASEQLMRK